MKKKKLKELLLNKKILYSTVAGIVVLAFLIWIVIHFSFSKQETYSPLNAIPQNAAIVLEVKQPGNFWSDLSVNSGVWRELINIEPFGKVNSNISFLDSLFKKNACTEKLFTDHPIYISFHFLTNNTVGFLYITSMPSNYNKSDVDLLIKKVSKSKAAFNEKSFNGSNIIEVNFPDKKTKLYYTITQDIFICSFQPELIESAIRQQHSGTSILKDKGFYNVAETAGKKVDANLYINFKYFPQLFSSLISDEYKKKISVFAEFANWSTLDISAKNDAIILNGFTNTLDTSANFLNVFTGQEPHEMSMLNVIPYSTASFIYFGFSDFEKWHKLYLQYFSKKRKLNDYNAQIAKINKEYKTNIENDFLPWIGKEIALVITEPSDSDITSNMYAVFKTNNISKAMTSLSPQSEIQGEKIVIPKKEKKDKKGKKKNPKEKKQKEVPSEINGNKIYEYKVKGILPALFGNLFDGVNGKYYTIIDDYVIFANSTNALTSFIKNYSDEKTLANNNSYVSFSKNISNESNIYLYCNIRKSLGIFLKYANKGISDYIGNNISSFKNFEAFAYQLKSSGKLFYNNICLKTNNAFVEESSALWTYKMDTTIFNKPQVISSNSQKTKKITAFDNSANIYLIEKDGTLLWKVQLKEKPLSDVFVIDYNKNGKSEYVFNTQSYIYCLDENGKNVGNFPLHLNDASTAPMTVVDYANNKDYRFIVPCKNKILNFTKDGMQSKGWNIVKTESDVVKKVTNIKFNGTDLLITSDKDGNIYIFDRKGLGKIKIKSSFVASAYSDFYLVKTWKKVSILTTDNSGNLIFISSAGDFERKIISKFSSAHYFLYEDLNNDNSKEYIFADNNKLSIYNSDLKQIGCYTLPSEISVSPEYYKMSDGKGLIGLVSSKINRIYLLKPDCSLYDGFPLNGSTPFSITSLNNDGSLNLIVGSDRTISNYSFK